MKLLLFFALLSVNFPSAQALESNCSLTIVDQRKDGLSDTTHVVPNSKDSEDCVKRALTHAENPNPVRIQSRQVRVEFRGQHLTTFDSQSLPEVKK